MNETIKAVGGADPVVKAVLDNIGRRYLVEHGEGTIENGSYWYDRYSDGWVVQGGTFGDGETKVPNTNEITFPIAFRDLGFSLTLGSAGSPATNTYVSGMQYQGKTTTSFKHVGLSSASAQNNRSDWIAQGYAA